jgi:hypothetical protein
VNLLPDDGDIRIGKTLLDGQASSQIEMLDYANHYGGKKQAEDLRQ